MHSWNTYKNNELKLQHKFNNIFHYEHYSLSFIHKKNESINKLANAGFSVRPLETLVYSVIDEVFLITYTTYLGAINFCFCLLKLHKYKTYMRLFVSFPIQFRFPPFPSWRFIFKYIYDIYVTLQEYTQQEL